MHRPALVTTDVTIVFFIITAHCIKPNNNQSLKRSGRCILYKKDKVLPYSLPSVGPRADPGVQAVSPQVTISGGRLPLLYARPAFYLRKHSPDGATTN